MKGPNAVLQLDHLHASLEQFRDHLDRDLFWKSSFSLNGKGKKKSALRLDPVG